MAICWERAVPLAFHLCCCLLLKLFSFFFFFFLFFFSFFFVVFFFFVVVVVVVFWQYVELDCNCSRSLHFYLLYVQSR